MKTNELFPANAWIADKRERIAYLVIGHSAARDSDILGLDLQEYLNPNGPALWSACDDGYVEIPPLPDEKALADQGYRLTGMAADCSAKGNKHIWVRYIHERKRVEVVRGDWALEASYNGWRWLVERIEEEPTTDGGDDNLRTMTHKEKLQADCDAFRDELGTIRNRLKELRDANIKEINAIRGAYGSMVHSPFVEKYTLGALSGQSQSLVEQNNAIMGILDGPRIKGATHE